MTFEQAAAQFAGAEAQYRAGQISVEQLQAAAAQCRVTDPQGRTWQIDPSTRQWLYWNGQMWTAQAAAAAAPAARAAPVSKAPPMKLGASLSAVAPGIAIDVFQRWSLYRDNPTAALNVAAPGLLSALLPPLVPVIGRWVALLILFGCLAWLAWPVLSQAGGAADPAAKGLQQQMGRGLVGLSLFSLIPRIWRAR